MAAPLKNRHRTVLLVLGVLLTTASVTMIPPMLVSLWAGDGELAPFVLSSALLLCVGGTLWGWLRNTPRELRLRDGFLVVASCWVVMGLASALPLVLAQSPKLTYTDAVFEAVSGLTTTGATTIVGLDQLPVSILYYRQQLQWLGGMGIIVLAVAVLPMLRIGGMQLYRAETPGPMKDTKLTPRITETAKALWYIYVILTSLCAVSYWVAGMDVFDAVVHSFTTLSTGGFSPHDASLGYFDSPLIESVAIFFMILGGVNFALHFLAWRRLSVRAYAEDPEVRTYFVIIALAALVASLILYVTESHGTLWEAFRYAVFQVVSCLTTTGYTTASFYEWPGLLPPLLLMLGLMGACGGSTSGGFKSLRVLMLFRQSQREIRRLIHPNAHLPIKIGGTTLSGRMVDSVWGFFFLYVVSYITFGLAMSAATDLDITSAFGAAGTSISNLGPGLGEVGPNFTAVNDAGKWICAFAMIVGRLEIFTVLVLFSPAFWRN